MRILVQNLNFTDQDQDCKKTSCDFSPESTKIMETSSPCRKEAYIFKWFEKKGIFEGHPETIV